MTTQPTLAEQLIAAWPPYYRIFIEGKEILRTEDLERALQIRDRLRARGIQVDVEVF